MFMGAIVAAPARQLVFVQTPSGAFQTFPCDTFCTVYSTL